MLIILGILMVSHMSWAFYKLDQISQTEAECISLLTESDIRAEDSTKLSIALRDLMTARIKMNNYTSSPYSMCAGAFIGFGIMVFCGSLIKRHEIIVTLWERVERLEKQLNTQ